MSFVFCSFTSVIDPYLSSFTHCLSDPHPLIRRHTLLLLSQLLQEDYIKWKGMMWQRWIMTIVDSDQRVSTVGKWREIWRERMTMSGRHMRTTQAEHS